MLDPILGLIFGAAWQGMVGSKANEAFNHACLTGLKALAKDGKIVNHDLEKALKISFLKAQQQIASECKQELVEPSRKASKGLVVYLPQDRPYLEWLDKKIKQLKSELEQVNKETVPSGIPIQSLDEIELLLTPQNELSQNRLKEVEQKLLDFARKDCEVTLYKTKLTETLFSLVSAYFAQEMKDNEKVFKIFTGQTLTRIDTRTAEMYAWLEEIIQKSRIAHQPIDWQAICKQILEEKEQQRLTSNQLTFGNHEIDDVYVPLGLVERQKVTQQRENVAAEEGSDLYREKEITQRFEHSEFLEQVIRHESSPNSKGKRLGIIGEPGAGKTTLLRQIANWIAAEIPGAIVIWVSLADLLGKELEPYLFEKWLLAALNRINKGEIMAESKDDFVRQFNANRVWLVLDGADEMAAGNSNPLAEIQRQIRTAGYIHKARIVLSCRQNAWDGIGTGLDTFDTYRTLEFSYPEQVDSFIDKWYKKIDPQRGKQLREALAASGQERIRDLVKNPLRCSLLCGTWQSLEGDLPDTKAKLYQRFVTTLYQWKEPRQNWIQQQELSAALGKLALSVMLNETSRFLLRESLGYREMGASSFELACRLGWLNLVGRDAETAEGIYAFYHPTFQEYFAALVIDDWHFFLNHIADNPQHSEAKYRIFEKQWKEVILLWLGREEVGKEEKEAFIKALVEFEDKGDNFYHFRAYILAARGIAEFKNCRLADEIVQQIVKWQFGDLNVQRQQWNTFIESGAEEWSEILKETNWERAIAALVKLIRDSGYDYYCLPAVMGLEQIGKDNQEAIAVLVELIRNSDKKFIWRQAADSLGQIGKDNPVAIAALVKLIGNAGDKKTWLIAADSLGQIGKDNPVAIAALVELIRNSDDKRTWWHGADRLGESSRWRAVESLGEIGKDNPVAIAVLVELIGNSGDERTRRRAAESLGEIGKANRVAIAALVELICNSGDEFTRNLAAYSLGKIDKDHPEAIAAIEKFPNF